MFSSELLDFAPIRSARNSSIPVTDQTYSFIHQGVETALRDTRANHLEQSSKSGLWLQHNLKCKSFRNSNKENPTL